jgi:hypothetical protein
MKDGTDVASVSGFQRAEEGEIVSPITGDL